MRRVRPGLLAGASAVLLAAGCASGGTTAADTTAAGTTAAPSPAATATTPAATTPTAPASAASPAATAAPTATTVPSTVVHALPDGYDAHRNAEADIRAALAAAEREHREVLIDFGADWCPDCRVLDVTFRSAEVEPLLRKDYVVVAVDVGEFDRNLDLAGKYVDLNTSGIPALVVLKSDGTPRIATNDGSFANAQTMKPSQVAAFLTRWAPGGER